MVKTEKFSQNVNFSPPDWTGEGIYDMLHVNKKVSNFPAITGGDVTTEVRQGAAGSQQKER